MIFFGQTDGVPSAFVYPGIKNGVVQLALTGGNFNASRKNSSLGSAASARAKGKPIRRLWGTGKGKFTTKGKYASATVRGTEWLVADYADHTLVTVRKGVVAVQNLVTKKTKLVTAGHSIIVNAKAKTPSARTEDDQEAEEAREEDDEEAVALGRRHEALHPVAAADQDLVDERGREQPVLDDARRRVEACGERLRVVDRAEVVGDHAAVRAGRDVPQLDAAERRAASPAGRRPAARAAPAARARRPACPRRR